MTETQFLKSLNKSAAPAGLSTYLKAMWLVHNNAWNAAHDIVQDIDSPTAARIHAYLHRVEGDEWNAGYWYRRAGISAASGDLNEEWHAIVRDIINREE